MKVRVKVKHLILFLLTLGLLIPLVTEVLLPRLQADPYLAKQDLLNKIESAGGQAKWRLIETHIIEPSADSLRSQFQVYVGGGSLQTQYITGSYTPPTLTLKESFPYLEAYVREAPSGGYLTRAAKSLALYYSSQGQPKKAIEILESAEQRSAWKDMGLSEQLNRLKEQQLLIEKDSTAATVSGTVRRSDGTPLAQVGVFLREEKDTSHSILDSEPYQTLTDDHGRFQFPGAKPGSYMLYLGLPFELVDGWTWPVMSQDWIDLKPGESRKEEVVLRRLVELKSPVNEGIQVGPTVRFEWEPYPGAASYTLQGYIHIVNGTVGVPIQSGIRENHLELPMEALYDLSGGISYKEKNVPDPVTLLGFANPDNKFSWSVEAYDGNGRLLSRSNGYRLTEGTMGSLPFFKLKGHSLTEADRLLLDGQLGEALATYKAAYEKKGTDVHSLRMVVRILEAARDKDGGKQELDFYLKKLAALSPTPQTLFKWLHRAYEERDWVTFHEAYKRYSGLRQGEDLSYEQSIYASALLKQGKLKEAREAFAKAMELDRSHRFVGQYLAVELLLSDTFEAAQSLADRYPERSLGGRQTNWPSLVRSLSTESAASTAPAAYWDELQEKLQWALYGSHGTSLDAWKSTTQHSTLKAFITALENVR